MPCHKKTLIYSGMFTQSRLSDKPGKLADLYSALTEHPVARHEMDANGGPVNAENLQRELATAR